MAQSHKTLREAQIGCLNRVLHLNKIPEQLADNPILPESLPILEADDSPVWKVLVLDEAARDVVSSTLRVSDLRAAGITIHLNLKSKRQPISDVPAVYLVEPTAENLQLILSDLQKPLYAPVHLSFLSSIPRPLLENFASDVAAAGVADKIASVWDQYLNFIVSESNLFSLLERNSYHLINSASTSDEALDAAVDRIVSGLFSVCVTMSSIPIIRCPKDGAAALIAPKLDRKLRDHILSSKENSLFSSGSRPLLIIADRQLDVTPMLSHSWTYESLVYDILDCKLNQITVEVPDESGNKKRKDYDLKSNDDFWTKNASLPFPTVAEKIDVELSNYRTEAEEITKKSGVSSLEDLAADSSASASQLKNAIQVLPALREKKTQLDMHMTILTALLTGIKNRQLDTFFSLEENILSKQLSKAQVLEAIEAKDKGNDVQDKLRLFIIWYLSNEQDLSRSEMQSFEGALTAAGADITGLAYVKQLKSLGKMTMMSSSTSAQPAQPSVSSDLFSALSSFSRGLKDAGLPASFDTLAKGVRNFLPTSKDLTLTQITHSLVAPSDASSTALAKTESWLYFDPRSASARGTMPAAGARSQQGASRGIDASFGLKRQGFSEAIVFVAGGGSIDEYQNLMEFATRSTGGAPGGAPRFRITYGATEILRPTQFLDQLQMLGKES